MLPLFQTVANYKWEDSRIEILFEVAVQSETVERLRLGELQRFGHHAFVGISQLLCDDPAETTQFAGHACCFVSCAEEDDPGVAEGLPFDVQTWVVAPEGMRPESLFEVDVRTVGLPASGCTCRDDADVVLCLETQVPRHPPCGI